jgi:hypothetical protein
MDIRTWFGGLHRNANAFDKLLGDEPVFFQKQLPADGLESADRAIHGEIVQRSVIGIDVLDDLAEPSVKHDLEKGLPLS